jgi:hypothetical protein
MGGIATGLFWASTTALLLAAEPGLRRSTGAFIIQDLRWLIDGILIRRQYD